MKGIILAGGKGTRLYPITIGVCKQLLPVFDKPMIYYPLAILMLAGIREVLIISTLEDTPRFQQLFKDGSDLGISISYALQEKPEGIAQSFLIGESFINQENVALILGDNIFYGHQLFQLLKESSSFIEGATIFGYEVKDPHRYGVLEFDTNQEVVDIVEKPLHSKSNFAVTGLYYYDHQVVSIAKQLKPSKRGEYEITDLNKFYLRKKQLQVKLFERGFAWLDTGTHDALQQASLYVKTIQERQGIYIACLEEIAYQMGFIDLDQLQKVAALYADTDYGRYLDKLVQKEGIKLARI
ncbi:Glucose-1-phosphate thymidylyltransferase 1 [Candidatus Rhabdochlamydia oedothoracis]|uniref:Glucose-1-phosphate thymidylyltransferase n=1 Tax=Candidatus Rhabdochlamydia oedothoracis TaxID=2720720 RepID=A0ABX8V1C8_9BACT|nr:MULTISPECIES: glucose-1-phosphate thymidylyltransferase RfbA [Rhabdochlamydia]KAG6559473.1 Glucose-1-phosphate thymidylyltransferase 1 [Candidatus Rhabdochlamydia sp. W815]MCL6756165.1 glucose-1-phosphate thymidylyltransferase RfbA [Candidatus Rhabdochlamydia oedothoracis]QYF49050.1 Glucose-1-phosphate thymidylyltransferase 1 [Candidatus Rhabdochlamydia oedothoracis]